MLPNTQFCVGAVFFGIVFSRRIRVGLFEFDETPFRECFQLKGVAYELQSMEAGRKALLLSS